MFAILAFTAAVATAPSGGSSAAPMTLEQKAGCGIALTMMGDGLNALGPLGDLKPGAQGAAKMLLRSMSAQGRELLQEAFDEGADRKLTAMQVYDAGLKDLFNSFGPIDPKQDKGDQIMNQLMSRCSS